MTELTISQQVSRMRSLSSALAILPKIEEALEKSETPEDVNEIRNQLDTVNTYIKRRLPSAMIDRQERYKTAFRGASMYVDASIKAGALWDDFDYKHKGGRPSIKPDTTVRGLTVIDAGFNSTTDATRCVRASRLDEEDVRIYYELCKTEMTIPTVSGLNNVWNLLNPRDTKSPTFKAFLKKIIIALNELGKLASTDEEVSAVDDALDLLNELV